VIFNVVESDSIYTQLFGNYWDIPEKQYQNLEIEFVRNKLAINITEETAKEIKRIKSVKSIEKLNRKTLNPELFPHDNEYLYSGDNFGPIILPQAEKTIDINIKNLPFYKRVIGEYEGNTITSRGNQVLINGEVAMMGDNRQNSIDSRYWGFVPFNHVVGKPVLIWMSVDWKNKKVRWDRLFTTVHGDGKPTSFFIPVLLLIGGLIAFNRFRNRKKKA